MLIQEGGQAHLADGGAVFGGTPYRLLRRLGRSGKGDVFLVEHWELGREMVAKVLQRGLTDDARLLDRVRLEATTLARLNHPNVVQISDFRRGADGRPFIVVEYLQGRSLEDELGERGPLSLFDALDFAHQALSGLAAAHALGVVHRDVTPHSLFLAKDKQGVLTLKVLDFGVACVLPSASAGAPQPLSVPTESGALLGTLRYLSPESALGQRVDQRADLYAVALILYEMVAGCGPFDGARDLLESHRSEQPRAPSELAQQPIPVEFDAVILHGLRKDPNERFQTAKEFQLELERLWQLLHQSHAFATTYFSVERKPELKTTGDLPKRLAEPSAPPVSEESTPNVSLSENDDEKENDQGVDALSAPGPTRTARVAARPPKLVALSFAVALITAVAVASGIVALLAKAGP